MQLQISFKYFILVNNDYAENKALAFDIISYHCAQ